MSSEKFSLIDLENIIRLRKINYMTDQSSGVARLLRKGPDHIGQKIIEESSELLAEVLLTSRCSRKDKSKMVKEFADLFFNAMVLAVSQDISLGDIEKELGYRHDKSLGNEREPYLQFLKSYTNRKSLIVR